MNLESSYKECLEDLIECEFGTHTELKQGILKYTTFELVTTLV